MHDEFAILINLTVCLTAALILGFITQKLKLSPLVGYLLAGIAIAPRTPGLVADTDSATQLAEIGVVLLMFGVGMHFDLRDLFAVRRVALPGALGQVFVATVLAMLAVVASGWGWTAGAVVGMAVSVASTVVLIRMLTDNNVLDSEQGHIAIGWLIVEDLFTVFVLVILPATADLQGGEVWPVVRSLGEAVLKIGALGVIVLWGGRKVIPRVLEQIARLRTQELFTLAILSIALAVAVGASQVFGVSMALGAFLAGMVVGQSEVSHQAAADALPMRNAFAVLFFVSVGMLFDPQAVVANPFLFLGLLAVILVAKPLAAIGIVWALGYSVRTALTVAVGLAQIGEFSFILADLAAKHQLLEPQALSLLVACAVVSITINPLLFRGLAPFEAALRRRPKLWKALARRADERARRMTSLPPQIDPADDRPRAIICGYGPVGRTAAGILRDFQIEPVIIDMNVDTVTNLISSGTRAIYGDATQGTILEAAGIGSAKYLLITVPDIQTRTVVVLAARELNPELRVLVRARYLAERAWLEEIGVDQVCYEEAEAAIGLSTLLLQEIGADEARVRSELLRIRARLTYRAAVEESGEAES